MTIHKETTVLTLLKEATQLNHDATEAVALSPKIASGTLTQTDYQKLLICNWYIHSQLYTAFSDFLTTHPTPALQSFISEDKIKWLQADIQALHISTKEVAPILNEVPTYKNIAAVIGGLYVVEGSMLGGQYICRQLRINPQLKNSSTFHFYSGYGKETGKRWAAFRQLALLEVQTPEAIQEAIDSAKQTFHFFETCYRVGME